MLEKIKHGFFLGIGFAVAMLGLSFGVSYLASQFFPHTTAEDKVKLSELHIDQSEVVQRDNKLVVLGSITNTGERKWQRVTLRAELFSSEKKFLDQCERNDLSEYRPKETRHFKIVCSSCKDISPADVSSHSVAVVEGW
jgi:hypothetical protein